MTNFIPIFPLGIVVFPGEELRLHIFEERYKQLINEAVDQKKVFGIPYTKNGRIQGLGTTVQVVSVEKKYDDGKMDVVFKGDAVFNVLQEIENIPDKLYSGAVVSYPAIGYFGSNNLMQKVIGYMRQMHQLLGVSKDLKKTDDQLNSYDVAHHCGLSTDDEYEVLFLEQELHRQEFLRRHLEHILPVVEQMNALKSKIRMNGHFREINN